METLGEGRSGLLCGRAGCCGVVICWLLLFLAGDLDRLRDCWSLHCVDCFCFSCVAVAAIAVGVGSVLSAVVLAGVMGETVASSRMVSGIEIVGRLL